MEVWTGFRRSETWLCHWDHLTFTWRVYFRLAVALSEMHGIRAGRHKWDAASERSDVMRLRDYYSRIVRDGRDGRPSIDEVRVEYRRAMKRQVDTHILR